MIRQILGLAFLAGVAFGQWEGNFQTGHYGVVHLFEWHWDTIADECETLLGPNKVGGVQISPPNENRIIGPRPWWERYQPVSYDLGTRSGDRAAFINMVERCNAVGVRIYPDIVINHMTGAGGTGTGTAGNYFDADSYSFPAVPYLSGDFNTANCNTGSGDIENYEDANQVRNCRLVSLLDLNQGTEYVRGKIVDYMNDLIDIGVAGFRVDACKHMWPGDLDIIFNRLNDLKSTVYGSGKKAFIFQEVIDQGGEPITAADYKHLGKVTEFKYGIKLGENVDKIQYLGTLGESWGLLPSNSALVFINNHDNQRGHGGGGTHIITFENADDLKAMTAYMMAWPYGIPRVMSSYYFSNSDEGPPAYQRSVESDGSCGNGWVCEHRWRQIKNMFPFAAHVQGTSVANWWTNDDNQIAFSRGNKGFIAINQAGYSMSEELQTGLQAGSYCNVISGDFKDGKCTGPCVIVDSSGKAQINVAAAGNNVLAIYPGAMTSDCSASCSVSESDRTDCGYTGINESQCKSNGCCWASSNTGGVPWCYHKA